MPIEAPREVTFGCILLAVLIKLLHGGTVEAMSDPAAPQFIIVEADVAASGAVLGYAELISSVIEAHGGSTIFAAPAKAAKILEDGSVPHAVLVLKFPTDEDASVFWSSGENQQAFSELFSHEAFLHAISVPGIPEEGLPEEPLPTTANVTIPQRDGPKAYMLVQGTVTDPEPIGTYMETIIPMIIERGGVYRAWTTPEGPRVLAGDWQPQYLVLSEWPSIEEPRDFWYSDTYQNVAIPTRQPASDFTVLLFEAST
ncbi:MAG: DUF1330 domain-containing protein [Rhodospirillaceae bacterium]|jgi:uncharacterized protein (DUF1330 family)|nr:DUF1330 domain-containing protein [Rhodospirillaceae bacterium]MBT5566332.1 DUF1330 domain-containing protein [Rhodospirillaceae bacterium]MBT6088425.1 DUF1330 domain-containing protein [Rhodospirillaceae bacterium]MBT6962187.1 DUF1330 domain-containing protein [Rhodospirillaceae bacterium]